MSHTTTNHFGSKGPRDGRRRLGVTALGLAVVMGAAGITSAAYTDHATLNLGDGGAIGSPNVYDIAVKDDASNLQDANTAAQAVVLPLASGSAFSEDTPVAFEATFVNRTTSLLGDLNVTLFDPDTTSDDPWDQLRFTVYLNGSSTAAISNASAADVNDADLVMSDVAPGEERLVRLEITIATGQATVLDGTSTHIGVRVKGESQ